MNLGGDISPSITKIILKEVGWHSQLNRTMSKNILNKKHAMVMGVVVNNSNLNGDRDNNGAPRVDAVTGLGEATDVCIKRFIRLFVETFGPDVKLYIKNDRPLNDKIAEAASEASGMTLDGLAEAIKKDRDAFLPTLQWLLERYWDLRAFGGVFAKLNRPIHGPVQFAISQSVLPVELKTISLSSQGITTRAQYDAGDKIMLGEKTVVRHGLYIVRGEISAVRAEKTGFTEEDKDLLLKAMIHGFDMAKSASRSDIRVCALYDFEYSDRLGLEVPTATLWDAVQVTPVPEVLNGTRPATCFGDYTVKLDEAVIPNSVTVHKLV